MEPWSFSYSTIYTKQYKLGLFLFCLAHTEGLLLKIWEQGSASSGGLIEMACPSYHPDRSHLNLLAFADLSEFFSHEAPNLSYFICLRGMTHILYAAYGGPYKLDYHIANAIRSGLNPIMNGPIDLEWPRIENIELLKPSLAFLYSENIISKRVNNPSHEFAFINIVFTMLLVRRTL